MTSCGNTVRRLSEQLYADRQPLPGRTHPHHRQPLRKGTRRRGNRRKGGESVSVQADAAVQLSAAVQGGGISRGDRHSAGAQPV